MTPLQIELLLWYFARGGDYRDGDFSAPSVRAAIDHFREVGYLTAGERTAYIITAQGRAIVDRLLSALEPIPMRLRCPGCGALHIDEGDFATKTHHTHACQECGEVWRPAVVPTVGVKFLPGFKNS